LKYLNIGPENSLSSYLDEVRRFPILKSDEEVSLARRWLDHRDPEALRLLLGSHLRLVVKMARKNLGYGLPLGDLISEGNLGLVQAANRFDPNRGIRFATYASWWIRAQIHEYILHSWSLVKMGTTAAQKKLFFNLRRLKQELRAYEEGDLPPETMAAIAERLSVPENDVVDMNRRLGAGDQSLNLRMTSEEGEGNEFQDFLVDEAQDPETIAAESEELSKRRSMLSEAMCGLNERERRIVDERVLAEEPKTLQELSLEYGVSRERIRQIESRAIDKLRDAIGEFEDSAAPISSCHSTACEIQAQAA